MKPKSTVKSRAQTEEVVVKNCRKLLKTQGWTPVTLFTGGIPIGGGRYATNPAKGIPDCIAFNPVLGKLVWIEFKKSHGGVVSPEQKEWHKALEVCGQTVWVINGTKLLAEKLKELYESINSTN